MITAPRIYIVEASFFARFCSLLRAASVGTYRDGCFGTAKGAAYSSVLSFFPILTTVATLLVQANADAVARTVTRLLFDVVPPGTESVVRALFNVHGQRPTWLLVVAITLAAWAGSGVMMTLMDGFSTIYRVPSGRPYVKQRLIAMALVVVSAIPVLGASVLIVSGNRMQQWMVVQMHLTKNNQEIRGWVRMMGQATNFTIAVGAIIAVTAILYFFGPPRKQSVRQVLPGAVLASLLWLGSTLVVAWYVRNITNYNVLYGSVGAVLALLVWSYVLALITFFGCEFNAVRERMPREA
ncbi:MAG: YihY/virulence factor BrkB family protein [Bryobacteraceae bacterium]